MLVPRWVQEFHVWVDGLLGPEIAAVSKRVAERSADPAVLQAAYGETVNLMERQLDEAIAVYDALAAGARSADWQDFAQHYKDAVAVVHSQWVDPAASAPVAVSGPSVLLTAKRAVTVVGIIWALTTVGHVQAMVAWGRHQVQRMQAGEAPPAYRRKVRR